MYQNTEKKLISNPESTRSNAKTTFRLLTLSGGQGTIGGGHFLGGVHTGTIGQ